jgi:hypothetical protein
LTFTRHTEHPSPDLMRLPVQSRPASAESRHPREIPKHPGRARASACAQKRPLAPILRHGSFSMSLRHWIVGLSRGYAQNPPANAMPVNGKALPCEGKALGIEGKALPCEGKALGSKGKALGIEGKALGIEGKALGIEGKALGSKGKALGIKGKALGSKGKALGFKDKGSGFRRQGVAL